MSDIFSHSQEAFRGQNQESLISSAFDYWCGVPWSPYSSRRGEGRGVDERQWWSQFKMRVACPYLACPTSSNVFQFQRPPAKRYVINHHHAACQIQDADISVHISHPLEYYVFRIRGRFFSTLQMLLTHRRDSTRQRRTPRPSRVSPTGV